MSYATAADLRARIDKTSTADDTVLTALLDAASQAIDDYCHRPDGFVAHGPATARTYPGSGGAVQWIDECVAITLVEVKDSATDTTYTSWAAADWIAFSGDPSHPDFSPLSKGKPYQAIMCSAIGDYSHFTSGEYISLKGFVPIEPTVRWVPTVQVTARWGYALAVPPNVREAAITLASRWYKRGQSAWADAVGSPDTGQLLYRQAVDPDVAMMLRHSRLVKVTLG